METFELLYAAVELTIMCVIILASLAFYQAAMIRWTLGIVSSFIIIVSLAYVLIRLLFRG